MSEKHGKIEASRAGATMVTDPSEQAGAERFRAAFGRTPEATASAPGRVSLLGADEGGGYALSIALPRRATAAIARRDDRVARVLFEGAGGAVRRFALGREVRLGCWLDRVQGVTRALAIEGLGTSGFDLHLSSDVPSGAGLSSGAALDVAILRALRAAFDLPLDDVRIAALARRAEGEIVRAAGSAEGPMVASLCAPSSALLLDTRTMSHEVLPMPAAVDLCVIDGGSAHRRATHVVTESERVLAAAAALREGDVTALGKLFDEASTVDPLVEIARAERDVAGARLTGGSGGVVAILARRGTGRAVAARIARAYERRSGLAPTVLAPT